MTETLAAAAVRGDLGAVQHLLATGADPNAGPDVSALMNAAAADSAPIVKELLRAGARVNATGGSGWTALMYAVQFSKRDDPAIVDLLLNAGAEVHARATGGEFPAFAGLTALDLARQKGRPCLEAKLQAAGARPGDAPALQPHGRRLYVACIKSGHQDCIYSLPPSVCPKCGSRWFVLADADAFEEHERKKLEHKALVMTMVTVVVIAGVALALVLMRSCGA